MPLLPWRLTFLPLPWLFSGSIVQCIKKAGSRTPVLLLDEIDKHGTSARGGDPASALLEVLDPEQVRSTFCLTP